MRLFAAAEAGCFGLAVVCGDIIFAALAEAGCATACAFAGVPLPVLFALFIYSV